MTLSAIGLALTPAGGSVCMRLKSRIRRRLAAVDILEVVGVLFPSTASCPRLGEFASARCELLVALVGWWRAR